MFPSFYHCNCYYNHNIYVKTLNKHVTYINEHQFLKDYNDILQEIGCNSGDKKSIVQEILLEIDRRKLVQQKSLARRKLIKTNYIPHDTSVYILEEEYLEPNFINLVEASKNMNYAEIFKVAKEFSIEKKMYGFPVFTPDFCDKLLKELKHFEACDFPKERPNTMNNYGILIDDVGFHNFSLNLRKKYLDPLAKALFPEWCGQGLDSHKIFTVGYKLGQDTDLSYHYDNSEVTLNVCLGRIFEGGDLYFGDMNTRLVSESTCTIVPHKIGHGILHRGQQFHGALPITLGERQNLIIWMRSSSIRNTFCPMCQSKPSLVPSTDYGDGFTVKEVNVCDLM